MAANHSTFLVPKTGEFLTESLCLR